MIYTIKGFSKVNEAEVGVFLEFLCFLNDPVNAGILTSSSSVFSKPSLYIWKSFIHMLLKPNMNNFEYKLATMWSEYNCIVVSTFFDPAPLWDWDEKWLSCPVTTTEFYKFADIFTAAL